MGITFSDSDCDQSTKSENIIIFTADDRKLDYIGYHNNNLNDYCKKHGYVYKFFNKNYENVPIYWSKLYYTKMLLDSNRYDYIMWLDSDSKIMDDTIKISDIICKYGNNGNNHIFIGNDFLSSIYNAGVFIIKNSTIGKKFINQCIDELEHDCIKNGKYDLGLEWAGICYEQGRMNKLINNDFYNYTSTIPLQIVANTRMCLKNSFILHKFSNKDKIMKCFDS